MGGYLLKLSVQAQYPLARVGGFAYDSDMKRSLCISIFATLSALASAAHAENLILLGASSNGTEIHVDRDSLRPANPPTGLRRFTTVQVWAVFASPNGRKPIALSERALFSFNCINRTMNTLAYVKPLASKTRAHDWRAADISVKYEPVDSGSLAEMAMNFACSGGRLPVAPSTGAETILVSEPDD